jgi:hypothetical protein
MRSCRDLSRHRHCEHSSIHTGYGHMSVLATGNWVHRQSVYISVLYYRVHRSLPQNHILTQLNPTNTHWLFLICLNIIIPSMPASSKWRIPFTFSDSNLTCVFYVLTRVQFPCTSSSMTYLSPLNTCSQALRFVFYSLLLLHSSGTQHTALRHPLSIFFSQNVRPSFTAV